MSDSEDGDSDFVLSPTLSSTSSLTASTALAEQLLNCRMAPMPTCRPNIYESSNPGFGSGQTGQYPYYNVYAGDNPGCYKDWADASGRVTNVKGSRHKGYKSWAQALEGWQKNCRAFHHHPPGFIDGSIYSPSRRPETPPPMTPPPSRHNVEHFEPEPSAPTQHAAQIPINRTSNEHRYWAIQSPKFIGVVSSTAHAQAILDEAALNNDPVTLRLVNNLSEAEDWLRLV
ncbi:hypothetical protein F5878DRAFT_666586 [Lentinula raphanica]|uniref:Ribonuclease H1 N-terminal domain-containing protein n=1 Tax=Lentinula raphanica TaxID=153919 RepID=A0AA38U6C6_9AGAR|nr:hypothetical protein C8R42DRAFT_729868 [Lentinula raphanica]KAJ3832425.1 hypothetical protein F5878DRAFT_666586 [Lentinula raphanica]